MLPRKLQCLVDRTNSMMTIDSFVPSFTLGFPIYEHSKQGGIYMGEHNEAGKLGPCVVLKEYDPNAQSELGPKKETVVW